MRYPLVLFMLTVSVSASAADSDFIKNPIKRFSSNTTVYFALCEMAVESGIIGDKPLEETFGCIEKYKSEIKPDYLQAKNKASRNKAVLDATKELYAYWRTSMDALKPGAEEMKFQYQKRLQERDEGLTQRVNKLLIEAGLDE